jgi:hypothetical protein
MQKPATLTLAGPLAMVRPKPSGVGRRLRAAAFFFPGPGAIPAAGRISMDFVTVDVRAVPPQWVLPGGFVDMPSVVPLMRPYGRMSA